MDHGFAISNIAWRPDEDVAVAGLMREFGFKGVEIAPTKYWPKPLEATADELRYVRRFWDEQGIQVVALQALLFGRPDLAVFGSEEKRLETKDYLAGICDVARELGATVLVFGSPGNRKIGDLAREQAQRIAVQFFREVGEAAHARGVRVCIEPNPTEYGCDFVTTSSQGKELVEAVKHPGFGLHLDAGGMTLSKEPIDKAVHNARNLICHVHASEVQLKPLGMTTNPPLHPTPDSHGLTVQPAVDHALLAKSLHEVAYRRWISIEMRGQQEGSNVHAIRNALSFVASTYASVFA